MKRFVVKTVTALLSSLIVLSLLASLDAFVPSVAAQAQGTEQPWPMFGQNQALTGYTNSSAPTNPDSLWNFTADGPIISSPAVAYGKVFVGSLSIVVLDSSTLYRGSVYALNQSTGEKIWQFTPEGGIPSSPAVAGGKVFVTSWFYNHTGSVTTSRGHVYALDQSNGNLIWNYTPPAPLWCPPIVAGQVVYLDGIGLDVSTGNKIWNATVGSGPVAYGKVFGAEMDGYLYAVNQYDGTAEWNYSISPSWGDIPGAAPAVADNKVLVPGMRSNSTYALDQSTGNKIWEYRTGSNVWCTPAVAYGKVFITSLDNKTYALDLSSGDKIWDFETGTAMLRSPAVADGIVFVTSRKQEGLKIYALNQSDGSKIWEYTCKETSVYASGPVIADGKLIAALNDTVYAFGTHSLALVPPILVASSFTVGESVSVNVTVKNDGDFTENFNLTLYYNNTRIETKLVTGLVGGTSRMVSFTWNTSGMQPSNYLLKAAIEGVPKDKLTTDNELLSSIAANAPPMVIPWELIIPIIVAAAVAAAIVVYLKKRPKKAKPPRIRMSADPFEILADGKSTSNITVELIDEKGNPYPAAADTQVSLSATDGRIAGSVTVPKGQSSVNTVLTSSMNVGTMGITAVSKGLKQARIGVFFKEKKRYCMHCGQIMAFAAKTCAKCGEAPPAGVDTKVCKNCKSIIPAVAEFCSECGAGQPE